MLKWCFSAYWISKGYPDLFLMKIIFSSHEIIWLVLNKDALYTLTFVNISVQCFWILQNCVHTIYGFTQFDKTTSEGCDKAGRGKETLIGNLKVWYHAVNGKLC